ncbi:MAG: formate dehydrogenase, partial [Gemmatimonadota bacterium]
MPARRVYVPRETAAVSMGADEIAVEIQRRADQAGESIQLIRNGSWGMSWLEPMVEVEVRDSRIAYGNVAPVDVPGLFEAGFLEGGNHPRILGPTHEIPYLANQDRWSFLRCGLIDPVSVDSYREHQGFTGLEKA